ncbi:MAG: fatty acid desaturase [Bdellovibrionales bacterium]
MLAPSPTPVRDKKYFKSLAKHCSQYRGADTIRSIAQASTTFVLFALAMFAVYTCVINNYWLAYAALLLPTAGLLVRVFIVQHDCGHGSYFKKKSHNAWMGRFTSLLTWTPYSFWRKTHNLHHAASGNLDRRGYGGIETMTVSEFKLLTPIQQKLYRLYRNAYLTLGLGTPFYTIIMQRFMVSEPLLPQFSEKHDLKDYWKSIHSTNLALLVTYGVIGSFIGFTTLIITYLPVLFLTSIIGGWLFFVQHQFEETYWENDKEWDYNEAALMSSSYYVMPKILQWFTGNIGIHHVHHLNANIPNYRLQDCVDACSDLDNMNRLTLRESLTCIPLALWDEDDKKLISFKDMDIKQAA